MSFVVFCKQKTAYELRISDWSSDVCSSDLAAEKLRSGIRRLGGDRGQHLVDVAGTTVKGVVYGVMGTAFAQGSLAAFGFWIAEVPGAQIGRASCRERVCPYV